MTDLEKTIELFESFGLDISVVQATRQIIELTDKTVNLQWLGYVGGFAQLHFDRDGKFIGVSAGED